jgi:hypothetical protein
VKLKEPFQSVFRDNRFFFWKKTNLYDRISTSFASETGCSGFSGFVTLLGVAGPPVGQWNPQFHWAATRPSHRHTARDTAARGQRGESKYSSNKISWFSLWLSPPSRAAVLPLLSPPRPPPINSTSPPMASAKVLSVPIASGSLRPPWPIIWNLTLFWFVIDWFGFFRCRSAGGEPRHLVQEVAQRRWDSRGTPPLWSVSSVWSGRA